MQIAEYIYSKICVFSISLSSHHNIPATLQRTSFSWEKLFNSGSCWSSYQNTNAMCMGIFKTRTVSQKMILTN